ncbi:HAMP domain-containing histidine kinase [Candidatus Saccharibacteria bacterium]|nr:HAMP domain-containing histidine kinase [Candidatus Saccharibacteria bacterium]
MSISFSFVFYYTSSHEVGKPVHFSDLTASHDGSDQLNRLRLDKNPALDQYFKLRADIVSRRLLLKLIIINLIVLAGGTMLSYLLARKTLQPIEENMESQSQFVSDASHELRTPLTALQTTNEVAIRKPAITSAEAKEIFHQNIEEVVKLRRLTDCLLKLAKNEHGELPLYPTLLSDIVSDAVNTMINPAIAKQIAIEDKVPNISVMADKTSLSQALTTILDNGIKYSSAKSTISITATSQGKFALLTIEDRGVGISSEHLPHVFERFYRVDTSRNKQADDGFGIGLSLAKKIVSQNKGEIFVDSTPGKGSSFVMKLQLA